MTSKVCPRCNMDKPDTEFGYVRSGYMGSYCRPCRRTYQEERRQLHPERIREIKRRSRMLQKYGISSYVWDQKFNEQGRVCAICHTDKPQGNGWHIDHNHATRRVRGILCHRCNLALGAYENVIRPHRAQFTAYLRKHRDG